MGLYPGSGEWDARGLQNKLTVKRTLFHYKTKFEAPSKTATITTNKIIVKFLLLIVVEMEG